MLRFTEVSAKSQDIPNLCWRGLQQARPEDLGGWGVAVARSSTLGEAIFSFCDRFQRDAPLMRLGLDVADDVAWFWRRRPSEVIGWAGDEEGQQYALGSMVRIVRSVARPGWLPRRVKLSSATERWIEAIPGLSESLIECSQPVVAIAVPFALQDRRTSWPVSGTDVRPLLEAASASLAGTLKQAFSSILPAIPPSIATASEMAGLSPRTAPATPGSGGHELEEGA
ncbi:MAG: AraC family transcriptional regulator ligand-binding domain-containing protein [Deltaproteobacteria bacterium]|jgi:hypothetical protein|nr:AraC family transcriptional regulator ligand-binding domain-containing protein [Deltaproteobacteria bacterium]